MFSREPVAIAAIVRTGILLLVAFGFKLSVEQIAAVMAFTEAILGLITRQSVTPNQKVADQFVRVSGGGQ